MMAAAQAAAEAAIRDAMNRERSSNNQQQPEAADIASLMQLQNQQNANQATATHSFFNDMMGFGDFQDLGDSNLESILAMMAQHQNVNQAQEADFEPETQLAEGPAVHYMTIAEDGKWKQSTRLILTMVFMYNAHFTLRIAVSGTILEATKTITGFPPEALLMTSW